jgi:endonuclease/exonuclease/phosphatase family metal-dependent hydrolase
MDRRFRPERIIEILAHYKPDLVLLQEVDDGVPRSMRLDLAREVAVALGFSYLAVGHNVALRKGRYGNATLSRFPILRDRNIDLTIELRKRRGCQHTTLLVEDSGGGSKELEVFNLHLGLSAWERARQVGTLVRSKEFTDLTEDRPCILGGDFNDWRSLLHPVFTEILGFRCATQRRLYKGALKTYPSISPTGGLDKIYFRGPLSFLRARTCRLGLCRMASDHLPVVADFELGA